MKIGNHMPSMVMIILTYTEIVGFDIISEMRLVGLNIDHNFS